MDHISFFLEDITIGEILKISSSKFQAFLERLKNMDVVNKSDNKALLFVCKSTSDDRLLVNLVYLKELINEDNLSKIKTYSYEFTEQKETLGFLVADTKLTQDNIMDVVVDFLFQMSSFGFEQEHLAEEIEKLAEAMKEIEVHLEQLIDREKLSEELGIPIEEIYPEEDEKKKAYYEMGMEFTRYCRIMELEKIKRSVIEESKN